MPVSIETNWPPVVLERTPCPAPSGWKPGAIRQPGMAAATDKPRSLLGFVLLGNTPSVCCARKFADCHLPASFHNRIHL
jgi:hypothetical protein